MTNSVPQNLAPQDYSTPKKKPFYTKWWFIILVIIVVVIIMANLFSKKDSSKESSATSHGNSQSAKSVKKIGTDVKVGDVIFNVEKVELTKTIAASNPYAKQNAQGKYVVVTLKVTNKEKKPLDIMSSFFKLKKGDTTYETDSKAEIALSVEKKALLFEKINPGNTLKGDIAFDVPATDTDLSKLSLQVQTGVFGTETDLISLTK